MTGFQCPEIQLQIFESKVWCIKIIKTFFFQFIYIYLQGMNNCSSSLFNNNNNEHLDWLTFSENQEKKEKKKKEKKMDVTKNKSYYYFFFVYSMFGIFPPSINHSSYHRFLGFPSLVSASCFFFFWFFLLFVLFDSTRFYWIQDEKYRFAILFITYSILLIIQISKTRISL